MAAQDDVLQDSESTVQAPEQQELGAGVDTSQQDQPRQDTQQELVSGMGNLSMLP